MIPSLKEIQDSLPSLEEIEKENAFRRERIQWAIDTAPNSPHLWQHKYKGTPLQILIESAKELLE